MIYLYDIFIQKIYIYVFWKTKLRPCCDHVKDMFTSYSISVVQKNSIPYIPEPVFVVIYRQENNGCLGLNGISP